MANVPLHLAAARLRRAAAPTEHDQEWDAAIARAKMQTALAKAPSRPPPRPRGEWAEIPDTPRPLPAPQAPGPWMAKPKAPRAAASEKTQATLDAFIRGRLKNPVASLPAF